VNVARKQIEFLKNISPAGEDDWVDADGLNTFIHFYRHPKAKVGVLNEVPAGGKG